MTCLPCHLRNYYYYYERLNNPAKERTTTRRGGGGHSRILFPSPPPLRSERRETRRGLLQQILLKWATNSLTAAAVDMDGVVVVLEKCTPQIVVKWIYIPFLSQTASRQSTYAYHNANMEKTTWI